MAKKMRRMTALVLALALCATQLAMPSVAAETDGEPVVNSLTTVSVDPETGTTTVVVSSESTDPDTGKTTTQTDTTVTDTDSGDLISSEQSTETDLSVVENNGAYQYSEHTEESEKTTIYPETNSVTGENGETDVNTQKETTEKTQGESNSSVTVTPDPANNQEIVSVSDAGYRETSTETTTTTTETTENVKGTTPDIIEKDDEIITPDGSTDVTDKDLDDESSWKLGSLPDAEDVQWTDRDPVEGTTTSGGGSNPTQELGTVTPEEDLKDTDDVVLNMTPTSGWVSATVGITKDQLLSGEYPELYDPKTQIEGDLEETADGWIITNPTTGTVTTVKATYTGTELRGYTITTVSETPGERTQAGDIKTEDIGVVTDSETSEYLVDDAMEQLIAQQATTGPDKSTTDDGVTHVTTYEKTADNNGYRTIQEEITEDPMDLDFDAIEKDSELYLKYQNIQNGGGQGFIPVSADQIPQSQPATTDSDGITTQVDVTEILAEPGSEWVTVYGLAVGTVVGYEISTTTTGPNNLHMSEAREIYGTTYTDTITTTTDPVTLETQTFITRTKRTITDVYNIQYTRQMNVSMEKTDTYDTKILTQEDNFVLVTEEDGTGYFLYKGIMYQVIANDEHGAVTKNDPANLNNVSMTYKKDENGNYILDEKGNRIPYSIDGDDIQIKNGEGTYWDWEKGELYSGEITDTIIDSNPNTWERVGNGLVSGFFLKDEGGSNHQAQQFLIRNGNTTRVVYCVEMGTQAQSGMIYDSTTYQEDTTVSKNGNKDNYYWAEYVDELRSVCLNGFWGTNAGTGSLEAVKDFLRRNGYEKEAESLTAGEALAATQAAIWEYGSTEYGSDGSRGIRETDFVAHSNGDKNTSDELVGNIGILKKLLVQQAEKDAADDYEGAAQAITTESITGSSISLKEKVGEDESGNGVFNTDFGFMLDVSTSSLNGNLIVNVYDEAGNKLGKYRLAQNSESSLFDGITGTVRPMSDGSYLLENIQLTENVVITLKLEGTQNLDEGIFIYNNPTQQDFIGLTSTERTVSLQFNVMFTTQDPSYDHSYDESWTYRTDSITSDAEAKRTDTANVTRTVTRNETSSQETRHKYILSTITKVTVLEEATKELLRWENYYEYLLTVINDEDGNDRNEEDDTEIILDEEVPLAAAPRTGDNTMMWALITLLALAGAAALSITPKRKRS